MTVTKHEILTIKSGVEPRSIIDAMGELPDDARLKFVDVEQDEIRSSSMGLVRFAGIATFSFRREVTDE